MSRGNDKDPTKSLALLISAMISTVDTNNSTQMKKAKNEIQLGNDVALFVCKMESLKRLVRFLLSVLCSITIYMRRD